jgi:hypothetical protein
MNENLILDSEKTTNIKKNEHEFFTIEKFNLWKHSIIVKFKISDKINYLNLFFILKSYVYYKKLPPYAICTAFKIKDDVIITQKTNIDWFLNIDYFMFKDWLEFRIKHDDKYNDKSEFFGIIFIYSKDLLSIYTKDQFDILNILRPKYPWSDNWLEMFEKQINKIELLNAKIQMLEEEIKNIKK